ncbi:type IV pilus assembly protein PilM [Halomonas sp. I1]|uniref:type IV pilus biogenesis protein PilM n=1 Tax=Halomonas sp. I1 TaxID=393536 RepID=UPI0028DF020E|nr:type IV pilus assembly protein PilM [Halomonas sp. I1]MDT8894437.1 type IV pilus assembly protein PilM [Halomonas sp. I1]
MWRFKAVDKGLIGVDIGSAAVRLIELRFKGGEPRVSGHAVVPLSPGIVVERHVHDTEAVVDALSRALAGACPLGKQACVAVPAEASIVKTLNLPASLDEDDIESRLQLESDKHIPFPFGEVAFDFQSRGPLVDDAGQQSVLLVACRRHAVAQRAELLSRAGLTPMVVDVDTFAVERAMAAPGACPAAFPTEEGEGVALMDIGGDTGTLYILHRGRITYRHDIALGHAPSGLGTPEAGHDPHGNTPPEAYRCRVLEPLVESLAVQFGRALQLYNTAGRRPEVRHMSLVGKASVVPGLAGHLAEKVGMRVTVINPLRGLKTDSRVDVRALVADAPDMMVAFGLAMRGVA